MSRLHGFPVKTAVIHTGKGYAHGLALKITEEHTAAVCRGKATRVSWESSYTGGQRP